MMTVERDTTPACLDGPRETTAPRSLSRRHRTRSADTVRSRTRSAPQLTSAPPHHSDASRLEENLDSHATFPYQNQQQQKQQQHRCSTSTSGDSDHHRRYHSEQNIHHFHHHYYEPPRRRRRHHNPPHTRKHTHHRHYDDEDSPSQCSRSPSHSSTSHSHPSLSNPSQSNPSQRSQPRSHSNPSHSHPSLCSPSQSGRSPTHSDTSHSHPSLSNLSESSQSPSLSNPSQPSRSRSHSSHSHTSQLSRSTSQCSPSLSGEQSPSQRRRSRSRLRSQSTTSTSTTSNTTTTSNNSTSTAEQPFRSTSRHSVTPGPEVDGVWREMQTSLSLCGCGFLGLYHLGVASCLLQHGPSFLAGLDRVAGASAGALVAALLVTAPDQHHVQASKEMVSAMAKTIRKKPLGALTPGFQLSKELQKLLDRLLPLDAHRTANGKLHISLTDVKSKQNEIVSDFGSREELIEALVASCHIPVYCGVKLPVVKGKHYCDGGLTDNLVRFNEGRTVTVSPFSGRQDIGPRDTLKKGSRGYYVNLHNQDLQVNFNNVRRFGHAFFPPRSAILQQYFELGHKDASHFLVREGLYEILKPGDANPVVYESSV